MSSSCPTRHLWPAPHGTSCTAVPPEPEAVSADVPRWVRARLELVCAPGEKCLLGSRITVEVYGAQNTLVATCSFGDVFVQQNPSARHLWIVDHLAGVGDLLEAAAPAGEGASRTQVSHEVYDG